MQMNFSIWMEEKTLEFTSAVSPTLSPYHFLAAMKETILMAMNLLIMVALWNRADHYIFILSFVMVALCNRADHYIFAL